MAFTHIRRASVAAAAVALFAVASCTVKDQTAPSLTGPSGLALTLGVSAIPDSISQDGGSQSSIRITAIGPDGKAVSALPLRLNITVGGVAQDYGSIKPTSVVTDPNGVATAVYTAPPSPANGVFGTCNSLPGNCVAIVATPTSTNFIGSNSEQVFIRLVPVGVILPPAGAPTALYTASPTPAQMNVPVTFDGSASTPGTGATSISSYAWNFGDGTSGLGRQVTHTYTSQQNFTGTLTVTNDRGLSASTPLTVSVGSVGAPSPKVVYSPAAPTVGQTIVFNADQSTAAPGHSLTTFSWNFGDGATASGSIANHAYTTPGAYNVVLSVADDTGQKGTAAVSVPVAGAGGGGGGATSASFIASPNAPVAGQVVFFNASGSSAATGHTLTKYAWDFGDGTQLSAATSTTSHTFATVGTFTVSLIVTDDAGTTAKTTGTVNVAAAGTTAPTSTFTFSPQLPGVTENVFFNASTSVAGAGHTLVSYAWTFGDGATGTGVTPTHAYSTAGTYAVQLRVTDDANQSATSAPISVTVGTPPSPSAKFTFSPTSPGRNDQVVFDASSSSTPQGQTIVDVAWNYGDGTAVVHCGTLFGNDPSCVNAGVTNRVSAHTFTISNTFVVNLVVTDSAGRTNSSSTSVSVVAALPDLSAGITISPAAPVVGSPVSFSSNGTVYFPGSAGATFAWTFGDGVGTSALPNPSYTYTAPGTYSVSLSVTDTKGRTNVKTVQLTVGSGSPIANLTVSKGGLTVTGDGSLSTAANGASITGYTFFWGDGTSTPSTGLPGGASAASHTYAAAGTYTVTLRVTDNLGRTGTSQGQTVTVP